MAFNPKASESQVSHFFLFFSFFFSYCNFAIAGLFPCEAASGGSRFSAEKMVALL